ncbi:hypothetical protein [Streptomyces sp. NPDC014746]|uniref:hypothetical protein n=1 Tax=Streptomyces sp. NPDC014746 TaxID=3364904 RepID=UPI003700CE66
MSEVALPIHRADTHGETLHPPLLEARSYAVDRAPYGPWRRQLDEAGAREVAERGRFAPYGALPTGVERDDPLPPYPWYPFPPSGEAFRYTLARMSVVREPWLRAIYDRGF